MNSSERTYKLHAAQWQIISLLNSKTNGNLANRKQKPISKSKLRNPFVVAAVRMRHANVRQAQLPTGDLQLPRLALPQAVASSPERKFLTHSLTYSVDDCAERRNASRRYSFVVVLSVVVFFFAPRTDCRYFMANADARRLRWRCCRRRRWRWRQLQLVNNAGSDCDCEFGLCARSLLRSAGAWVSYKIIYILFHRELLALLALLALTVTAQLASAVAWRVASGLIRSSRLDFHMYMLWIECFMGLVW